MQDTLYKFNKAGLFVERHQRLIDTKQWSHKLGHHILQHRLEL